MARLDPRLVATKDASTILCPNNGACMMESCPFLHRGGLFPVKVYKGPKHVPCANSKCARRSASDKAFCCNSCKANFVKGTRSPPEHDAWCSERNFSDLDEEPDLLVAAQCSAIPEWYEHLDSAILVVDTDGIIHCVPPRSLWIKRIPSRSILPSASSSSLSRTSTRSRSPRSSARRSSEAEVPITGVTFQDREGQPIDFGQDPDTIEKSLKVVSKQFDFRTIKEELEVKEELDSESPIMPADSLSSAGDEPENCTAFDAESAVSGASWHSLLSVASSASNGVRCFLSDAVFMQPDHTYIQAGLLVAGSAVVAADASTITVKSIAILAKQEQELIDLFAGGEVGDTARLTVSPTHRVMVQRGQSPQTLPAGHLREGDQVYVKGGHVQTLVMVQKRVAHVQLVDITFHPDVPVEATYQAPAIWSKGTGFAKRTRRSLRRYHGDTDNLSIPSTDDGF